MLIDTCNINNLTIHRKTINTAQCCLLSLDKNRCTRSKVKLNEISNYFRNIE